jgi:hypothetical protein
MAIQAFSGSIFTSEKIWLELGRMFLPDRPKLNAQGTLFKILGLESLQRSSLQKMVSQILKCLINHLLGLMEFLQQSTCETSDVVN